MKTKIKGILYAFGKFKERLIDILEKRCFLFCAISAPVINLLIEMLSRRSVIKGVAYAFTSPVPFLYNCFLILVTLLAAAIFRKRMFTLLLTACLWIWMGVVNCILLGFRVTPFGATDFLNIKSALDIVHIYMSPLEIGGYIGAIVLFLAIMLFLYIKAPRLTPQYKQMGIIFAAAAVAFSLCTNLTVKTKAISASFGNLADAYKEYGFAYCFSKSLVDRGVDKPADYSHEVMDQIAKDLSEDEEKEPVSQEDPNIIIVQLESFFNVNRLKGLSFSQNPIPNFTKLSENNPSGFLTVPVIGAGTVNTEFEVLTGMSLHYFGTGEYPYKTILQSSVSPSICYDLEKYGYACHAIHNNNGNFYDRNTVYPNLGFDDFTSIEYMDNVRVNALGWAKDSILTEQVIKAMDSTDGRDFVYTVSVQPHGRYPSSGDYELPISVYGAEDIAHRIQYEYYATQLYDTDNFINSLIKALDTKGEPYIVVFYGDHLPSLGISDDSLAIGDSYQTDYVIHTNTDLKVDGGNISSYQLSAKVMKMAGLPGGVLTTLHQTYTDEQEYQQRLELLEYDLLYGDREVLGGAQPFKATDMKMGIDEISIVSARQAEEGFYLICKNITDKSCIFVNDKLLTGISRIDNNTLFAPGRTLNEGDVIQLSQMGSGGEPLSYSAEFVFK
ncbi:MAG: sulfatase-like hydrolase/transferase [Clostridiaceae bacterium]|nr:sulfatase-like hydrolase/transferase [Clostridiaceae bacterium]